MFDPAFMKGETWGFHGCPVEHIETHAAHVLLVGDCAFKIKKEVKFSYLDFSTVEKRRTVLERELEINRVNAPSIYLGVIERCGEPVLAMNRFDAQALLSAKLKQRGIDSNLACALAEMVAESHEHAPGRDTPGAEVMFGLGEQLSKAFTDSPDIFRAAETLEFHALYEAALRRLKSLLNERGTRGLVRRCHGDMHCGNIVVLNDKPVLFDAIEFSEKIATVDVLYDLAFLLMDLLRLGQGKAANIVLNHYLHLRRAPEDLSGLALLPLFLSTRAGVRALVTADLIHEMNINTSMQERGQALDYFRASIAFLKPPAPVLLCVGGLSGTGKSTLGASIAPDLGAAPGAIHVRSDIERKVLAGIAQTERLPFDSYTRESSGDVYSACFTRAEAALSAGHSVVLDAVFARESERNVVAAIAQRTGARFEAVWLEAPPAVLKSRVAGRVNDASDATIGVVEKQLGYQLGDMNWMRIDASVSQAEVLSSIRRLCPALRISGPGN